MAVVLVVLAAVATLASVSGQKIVRTPPDGNVEATEKGVTLKCLYNVTEASTEEPVEVEWFLGGSDDPIEEGVSVAEDGTSVLKMKENYEGEYSCKAGNEQADFTVKKFFKLEKWERSVVVFQGEDHKLFCKIKEGSNKEGTISFAWYIMEEAENVTNRRPVLGKNDTHDDIEPHFKVFESASSPLESVLKIEDARYEDRAIYQCEASNDMNDVSSMQIMVRVKDKYAALYPFVGIVAEVIVLCLIIFICEKRRASKEAVEDEEEEEFNGAAGGSGAAGNSSVRHRRN